MADRASRPALRVIRLPCKIQPVVIIWTNIWNNASCMLNGRKVSGQGRVQSTCSKKKKNQIKAPVEADARVDRANLDKRWISAKAPEPRPV